MSNIGSSKVTVAVLAFLALGVWGLLFRPFVPFLQARAATQVEQAAFTELTVQRINIVDADGKLRLAIASGDRFPAPVARGKTYASNKRAIRQPAGMIFFNAKGDETGGLITSVTPGNDEISALAFDFNHQMTDAIGLFENESLDGARWSAGLMISDRRPYEPGDLKSSSGTTRIQLQNENQDARLIISDAKGKPRIRLGVDRSGVASFEILDEAGKVLHRLPQ